MSENSLTAKPLTDLTPKEMEQVEKFKEAGLPGIAQLEDSKIKQMMDLYLSGKTYSQISQIISQKKEIVMYLSSKYGWFADKRRYIMEVENSLPLRLLDHKIESQDFLLNFAQTLQGNMNKKLKKYLATGDEKFLAEMDMKVFDKYLKTLEILHKGGATGVHEKTPSIGINIHSGSSVSINDGQIAVGQKEHTLGEMLAKMADERRKEQLKKSEKGSDDAVVVKNDSEESE